MSYLLAETGGLLLASMILGCALGYLVGSVRRSKTSTAQLAPATASTAGQSMTADDRVVYEDNLRRARSEIVRLEKQNNRMTSALEAARSVPASVGVGSGVDPWDAASADSNAGRAAEYEADLAELRDRNEQVEDALAIREHEIEELEESVRVMHQRVANAEAEAATVAEHDVVPPTPLFGAPAMAETTSESEQAESEQLRTELEHARDRLVRLDERQLELDQLISRLRGPAARAERLEVETGRLRDRLRLREARLRQLEQGLAEPSMNAKPTDVVRGASSGRRSGRRVRASSTDQVVAGRRSSSSASGGGPARDTSGDLTRIDGIGPVLARMLHQRGVSSLSDLAELTDTDIAGLETQLPEFATRIRRDRWVEQAQQLLSKRHTR